jgi:hypothetical protein
VPGASADQSSRERERVDRFAHAHRDREGGSR